jgi:hypothetical protein
MLHGPAPAVKHCGVTTGIPEHIPGGAFNQIWQIDYSKDGKAKTSLGSQKLLAGD